MPQDSPTTWFPQTQIRPPLLPENVLPRASLLENLHRAALTRRLTLISAPAGSGKTTLLTALLQAYPDLPLAWLTLDTTDADPIRFLNLLLAALQTRLPAFGAHTQAALHTAQNPVQNQFRVLGVLINDLMALEEQPLLLAIDNLHRIQEPLIFQALDYLLEHAPPVFHLVIATRYDPPLALARLRAQGCLAEFHLPDLRFRPQESAALLNDCLHLALNAPIWLCSSGGAMGGPRGYACWRLPSSASRPVRRAAIVSPNGPPATAICSTSWPRRFSTTKNLMCASFCWRPPFSPC